MTVSASKARRRALLLLLAAGPLVLACAACTGDARRGGRTGRGESAATSDDGGSRGSRAPSSSGEVSLSNDDLAPMDAYLRRRVWVLGDDVEVVASKEYFVQNLSIAATTGFVRREDKPGSGDEMSILTFTGRPEEADITTAPRVSIGLGLSVFARKRLVIRFTKTTNADLPVRLRIAANGKARIGSGTDVFRREESIVIGAQLRRQSSGAYVFEEQ